MCENRKMQRLSRLFMVVVSVFAFVLPISLFAQTTDMATILITATVPGVTPGGGSGGGSGGGGGGFATPTSVTFSGRAFPLSKVTILRDGLVAVNTIAGPDARFSVTLSGLSGGNYNFSIFGEDSLGRRSSVFSFPLYLTESATTTVSGIFISPTISVDMTEVKRGDNINIFGIGSPSSDIIISVHSSEEHFLETKTDTNGVYLYTFDTSPLEIGSHDAKSKAIIAEAVSEFGKTVTFKVGNKNIKKDETCEQRGDLSHDCKINIVDFSILAYWYKRPNVPPEIDLNNDGKISIVDFSILAYYWTG